MQLTIKTLKGQTFNVQIQPNQTINDLKNKIKEIKSFQVQTQKIVFKGKATNNDDQLGTIGVKEGDFLVIMILAKKPQPKKEQKKVQQPVKAQEKPKQQKSQQEKKQQKKQTQSSPQNQAKITELMSMGFPRDQCQKALQAAFGDADRAVQYLLNGIPENIPAQSGGQIGGDSAQLLAGLVNHPQFAQIRQLIRSNPAALHPLLQQISQSSPQLYALISQNPQLFERLILEGGGQGGQGGQVPQPPPGSIMITPAEDQAIKRLMALGFSKMQSAQAYLACDKNQQLAANLLFDRLANGDIDMVPQQQQSGNKGGNSGGNNGGNKEGDKGNKDDDDDNLFN